MDASSANFQFKDTWAQDCKVKLLGIRGYALSMGIPDANDLGIYDDLICHIIDDKIECFEASTDPGKFYIDHPLNPLGCAKLCEGLWKYRMGFHQFKHNAFVQADDVKIDRINHKGVRTYSDTGKFGINIHSGGQEVEVGRYSAGCQVIKCPNGAWGETWMKFYKPIAEGLRFFHQIDLPYLLVDRLKAVPA